MRVVTTRSDRNVDRVHTLHACRIKIVFRRSNTTDGEEERKKYSQYTLHTYSSTAAADKSERIDRGNSDERKANICSLSKLLWDFNDRSRVSRFDVVFKMIGTFSSRVPRGGYEPYGSGSLRSVHRRRNNDQVGRLKGWEVALKSGAAAGSTRHTHTPRSFPHTHSRQPLSEIRPHAP